MPIYVYKHNGPASCENCEAGFERLQKLGDSPLTECPECNAEIQRVVTAPNLARPSPSLDESNIDKHGFTQYRKLEKGVYEKTAGKGPGIISSKDPD